MSNNTNINNLAYFAKKALDKMMYGQEYMLSHVVQRVRQAYDQCQEDAVIRQVAYTLEKIASKSDPAQTINQKELTDIYNHFAPVAGSSKFRMLLGDLMLDAPHNTKVAYDRLSSEDKPQLNIDAKELVEPDLFNDLQQVFGHSSENTYDTTIAKLGQEYVKNELTSLGFNTVNIKTLGGNKNALVFAADLETSRGKISVAIPIETTNKKLLMPSVFVSDGGLEELAKDNLVKYIDKKLAVNNKQAGEAVVPKEIVVDNVAIPKELEHIANDFENSIIESATTFGKQAIANGKTLVATELYAAGFKNSQVSFNAESNDSAIYMASINTPRGAVSIEVPVEMKETNGNYVPLSPTHFAYDGVIEDFTSEKLQRFAVTVTPRSSGETRCAMIYEYMRLPELKNEIVKAAAENDYTTCEMILQHIEDKFSEGDYKNCVADYQNTLLLKSKPIVVKKCSKEISAGQGSIEPRCGHLLVPMSKVIVGEDGMCRLKSSIEKEKLNKIEDSGALINTSKIILT